MKIFGNNTYCCRYIDAEIKGFNFTQEKKVVDIGPLEVKKKETNQSAGRFMLVLSPLCRHRCYCNQ